jgi:hypothetical protein
MAAINYGIFDTRNMMEVVRILTPPSSMLLDLFFPTEIRSNTEFITFDIVKKKRRLAPFVHPLVKGRNQGRDGFEQRALKPAYVKMFRDSQAAELIKVAPGENPFSDRSIQQRAADLLVEDLQDTDEQLTRRLEWMAARALTEFKVPIIGEGFNFEVDFLQDPDHITDDPTDLEGGEANGWGAAGTNPFLDLDNQAKLIARNGGQRMTDVVMGDLAWEAFLQNESVVERFNNRRIDPGLIIQEPLRSGSIFRGNIGGYNMWSDYDWYYDEVNEEDRPMIPDNYVICGSRLARTGVHFGQILDLMAPGGAPVRSFPKAQEVFDPSGVELLVQSAPIVAIHEVSAFTRIKVLADPA